MAEVTKLTPELLYERFLAFAKQCQKLVNALPKTIYNIEYGSQLIRSSASPGANYIEAIEGASRRDFTYRLKICRKECRESNHWLLLIQSANDIEEVREQSKALIIEAREFIKILTSSILTSERNRGIIK